MTEKRIEEKDVIKYGLTHVHLESALDTGSKMEDFFIRMKELSCPAVCVSEHGVMTSLFDAIVFGEKYGIKVIPGVEAYLKDELGRRSHLILYAKNEAGYHDLCKIVTESFKGMEKVGKLLFPIVTTNLLKKYAGNIIATSACVNGPLAGILRTNEGVTQEISKIKKGMGEDPGTADLEKKTSKSNALKEEIANLRSEKNSLSADLKKKSFAGDKDAVQKKIDALQAKIIEKNAENTGLNAEIKKLTEKVEAFQKKSEQIEHFRAMKKIQEELESDAEKMAKSYLDIFGKGNFFIELQYHGMQQEKEVYPVLANIAKKLGIPVVAANDCHIARGTDDDFEARQIMRSLRFNVWEEIHPSDKELYIKSDRELSEALSKILPGETVFEAMENVDLIVRNCNVSFEKKNHYPKYPTKNGETAIQMLRRLCRQGIMKRFPEGAFTDKYKKRLEYELSVMEKMGVIDYILTVWDFLNFGKKLGRMPKKSFLFLKEHMYELTYEQMVEYVNKDQSEIGFFIGPGRGSAAGSLVCFLLGITSLDPIKYGLLFERFLNIDRVSMPDIDSDIAKEARDVLIEYVRKKYGENAVCCIVTKQYAKARGAVRDYARVAGSKKDADSKEFLNLADQIAKKIPSDPKITLAEVKDQLRSEFASNKKALSIIEKSLLIEGQLTNYGMHAAGVIISDNDNVGDYVPLMWDSANNIWKCQCDMVQAEEICGLLKMDFLGLRTLSVITETIRRVKQRHGVSIDPLSIPFEKEVFSQIFSNGKTNSVFQFESSGMKQMLQQFRPQSFEDLILLVAAYRPGPMDSIPKIIKSKFYGEKPRYCIPEMGEVLDVTYGYPIYQEQLMDIFHKFAGFSLGEADIIRRYMSKKKVEKFLAFKDRFIEGLVKNGAASQDAENLWNDLVGFAKYGFNKSHAAAYALVAYQTAYLKYHYPVEYICSELNSYPTDKIALKIPGLSADLPSGSTILSPDVNESEYGFSITKDGNIIFGLGNIKSVGRQSMQIISRRPFASFGDFIKRGHVKKNISTALIMAGALDRYNGNRKAMLTAAEQMAEAVKKIEDTKEKIEETNEKIRIVKTSASPLSDLNKKGFSYKKTPKAETLENTLKKQLDELNENNEALSMVIIEDCPEDKKKRLSEEKELLGLYISENPLDEYPTPESIGGKKISDLVPGYQKILGIISGVRIVSRKKDNHKMAFFTLSDKSGSIEVCCFAAEYAKFASFINDGDVISLSGKVTLEEVLSGDLPEDEGIQVLKISIRQIEPVMPQKRPIVMSISNITKWASEVNTVKSYKCIDGHPLYLAVKSENKIRKTEYRVSQEILFFNKSCRLI